VGAADADYVALAVGDEKDGAGAGEVVGSFEQVDAGLEAGAAAAADLHSAGDVVDGDIAGSGVRRKPKRARPTRCRRQALGASRR
jgi:hypothetical protein